MAAELLEIFTSKKTRELQPCKSKVLSLIATPIRKCFFNYNIPFKSFTRKGIIKC